MGEFPSGQRGQTVNLLAMPSVVRIHLPPPNRSKRYIPCSDFLCLPALSISAPGISCLPWTQALPGLLAGNLKAAGVRSFALYMDLTKA